MEEIGNLEVASGFGKKKEYKFGKEGNKLFFMHIWVLASDYIQKKKISI